MSKFSSIRMPFDKLNFEVKKESHIGDTRFVEVEIYLMHLGENYNGSYFEKEIVERKIPTLSNTPILGYIEDNDYSDHRQELKISDDEYKVVYKGSAYGVIPESNNARFVERKDKYGEMRNYLVVDGLMWTKWEEPIDILLNKGFKSQSMELDKEYSGQFGKDGLFHFTDFSFFGACLLGDDVEPAMEGASVEVKFEKDVNSQIFSKLKEYNEAKNEKEFDEEYGVDFKEEVTNFPNKGDNKEVTLRNSKFKQAPYEYVLDIRENHKDVWRKGGNEFGNTAFSNWGKVRSGQDTDSLKRWIVRRERFMERHQNNKNIAGVMAVFKWGGVVNKGLSYMKSLIKEEKDKKSNNAISKDKIGQGEKLDYSTSKDDADFDTQWGNVDKVSMRDKIYTASNYKSLIDDFYLIKREGWEENQSQIKYPIGIIKNNKLVLSAEGCKSALSFLEKNTDDPNYNSAKSKLKEYYKKLGLDTSSFEEKEDGEDNKSKYERSNNMFEKLLKKLNPEVDGKVTYEKLLVSVDEDKKVIVFNDTKESKYKKVSYELKEDELVLGEEEVVEFGEIKEEEPKDEPQEETVSKEEYEKVEKELKDLKGEFAIKEKELADTSKELEEMKPKFEKYVEQELKQEKLSILDEYKLVKKDILDGFREKIDEYSKEDLKEELNKELIKAQDEIALQMAKLQQLEDGDEGTSSVFATLNFSKKDEPEVEPWVNFDEE